MFIYRHGHTNVLIRPEKIEQNDENKAEYRTLGAARADDGRSSSETPEMLFIVSFIRQRWCSVNFLVCSGRFDVILSFLCVLIAEL